MRRCLRTGAFVFAASACALCIATAATAAAADISQARGMALRGEYQPALEQATAAVNDGVYGEDWRLLKADMELMLGRYEEARRTLSEALTKYAWSIRLRWKLREAARFTGDLELAKATHHDIARLVESAARRYTDTDNLMTLGRIALEMGADPKEVQDAFYQRAKRNSPGRPDAALALGELALSKRDFQLAAETFRAGIQTAADQPDLYCGLAAAVLRSDPAAAREALTKALAINPQHVPSLLLAAEQQIDAEQYDEAEGVLAEVLAVNPSHPAALAYRAAIAHLRNQPEVERRLREQALAHWSENPEVDFLIGRELSQKYRFAEGVARQRLALAFDPDFLPAKKQLADDLLRLGQEQTGWRLADEVFAADRYDVAMYNLVTLRDELAQFETLENEHFLVRMTQHEAAVYGPRVLALLERARETLCAKYGLELESQVTVEIFADPDDFAVRTFGLPGVSGYLGVCFGQVITANSPAAQLEPSNWESVLWHEFTHVVTLNLTANKMPRWLSEGISVHEERQADPAWGQAMTPAYREIIRAGDLTPIGDLSGAFLSPKSSLHVMFAYYESSLVVEYLVDQFGFDSLLAVLHDLGDGVSINDAIERHAAPPADLEPAFAAFVQQRVAEFAPGVDWSAPDVALLLQDRGEQAAQHIREWTERNAANLRGLLRCARSLMDLRQWDVAREVLMQAVALHPGQVGAGSAPRLLAEVHRATGDAAAERDVLSAYAPRDADAVDVFLRLIELETARADWPAVRRNAERLLAVNPLIAPPHRALAEAAEHLGDRSAAIAAWRSVVSLGPEDPAGVHFRLAQLLLADDQRDQARREILLALETAPRYREAHRLLLEIVGSNELPGGNESKDSP